MNLNFSGCKKNGKRDFQKNYYGNNDATKIPLNFFGFKVRPKFKGHLIFFL